MKEASFVTLEPEGQWKIGPDQYKSLISFGECIVQVPPAIPINIYIIIILNLFVNLLFFCLYCISQAQLMFIKV
jgi:hypothetical protein